MDINNERYTIVFTHDAVRDIYNIFNYISQNLYAPTSVQKLMLEIDDSIENLKYMPRAYNIIKTHLETQYRRMIIKNYVIIYTVDENDKMVYIVHMYYRGKNYLNEI